MTTATVKKTTYRPRYVYGQQALHAMGRRQADAAFKAWETAKTKPQKIAAGIMMAFLASPTVLFFGVVIHALVTSI